MQLGAIVTGASGAYAHYLARVFKNNSYETIGITRSNKANIDNFDRLIRTDLSHDNSIKHIRNSLADKKAKIKTIVANAGMRSPTANFENLTSGEVLDLVNVHCCSLVRVLHGIWDYKEKPLKVVAITSRFSSFTLNNNGLFKSHRKLYSYSMAKACLNMLVVRLRNEFPVDEIELFLIHPGKLKVGISAIDAKDDPYESAKNVLKYISENKGDLPQIMDAMNDGLLLW